MKASNKSQTKKELKLSEERLYKVFRSSPAPTFISSLTEGRYIDVNESGLRLLGYARTEMIGRTVRDLSVWDDRQARSRFIPELLKKGSLSDEPIRLRTKHGKIKDVLWSCEIIILDNEKAMLSHLFDISEHRKMEEALRESERRLTDIIDFLPDATFAIDLQGKVIAWNRAVEDMTGAKKEEMLGKCDHEYALPFYGEKRPMLIDFALKSNRKLEKRYNLLIRKNGGIIMAEAWVRARGRDIYLWGKSIPLYDSNGDIAGAIESVRDITDRKRFEDDIRKREAELEAKARELEDMNAALRVLLKQRESDRRELEGKILANIKILTSPYIERLKSILKDENNRQYINAIESSLNKIVSPFAQTLSMRYSDLTNREIQVANLIREGKTTKEITAFLHASESAVNMHRYRIRQKLGISKGHSLRAFLSGLT